MADADALVNIQKQAFERLYNIYHDEQSPYLRGTEEFERWFERGHYVYKIYADGTLAGGLTVDGTLVGYASMSDEKDGIYEFNNLAVLPEYRRRGYGKLLLDHAKEKVCEFGGREITIGIIDENTELKEWYQKNGFIHTGTRKFDHLPFTVGFMEWGDKNADTYWHTNNKNAMADASPFYTGRCAGYVQKLGE